MRKSDVPLALLLVSASALVVGLGIEGGFTYGMRMVGRAIAFTGACFFLAAGLFAWFWKDE